MFRLQAVCMLRMLDTGLKTLREFFTEARESAYCQQVWVPSMSLVLIIRRRLWWQDWFLMNRVLIWIIF